MIFFFFQQGNSLECSLTVFPSYVCVHMCSTSYFLMLCFAVQRHSSWESIRFIKCVNFYRCFFSLPLCLYRPANHRDTPPKLKRKTIPTFPERPISCRSAMAACLNGMFMSAESQSESMRGGAERISPGCTSRIEWAWRQARRERKAKQSFLSPLTGCF